MKKERIVKMEGEKWVNIRSDYKKGLSYAEIGRRNNVDWRTAKDYCQRRNYSFSFRR